MKTFADDLSFAHNDATHHGIGAGEAGAFAGQRQRVLHETDVVCVHDLVEKRVGVGFRVEGNHVVDLLAGANEADGQAQFARDGDNDAALGRAIEFRENDSGDANRGSEFARLSKTVLARVASRTSKTSCGAPGITFAAVRFIFSSSAMRFDLVCRRPAVSTITTSEERALAAATAS